MLTIVLVWAGRFFVNPDGVSYLDLSDNFRSGNWSDAVNGHWSPAYPLLLSMLLKPWMVRSPWESIVVHVINGWLFLVALAAFEFFLWELRRSSTSERSGLNLNTGAGLFAAHMIFLWCMLVLITVRAVTPDMLLAAIGFVVAGLVTRIRSGRASIASCAALGILLGCAALTKSFMFGVSLVLLLIMLIRHRRIVISVLLFAIVVAPQAVALYQKTGRISFGDSAKVVYALKVNQVSKFSTPRAVTLVPEMSAPPRVLAFPTNMANQAYPLWDDPSAWYAGTPVTFSAASQLRAVGRNLKADLGIALKILIPLLVVVICREPKAPLRNKLLIALSLVVLAGYALLYSEARLVGFWICLATIAALAGITLDPRRDKIGKGAVHAISIICAISIITYVIDQSFSSRPDRGLNARDLQSRVAQKLNEIGAREGSRVGLVGDESDIYWARLARVQVAAQVPLADAPAYWALPEGSRNEINRRIARTGARAIVASWTSPPSTARGWTPVPGTRYSILPLTTTK